MPEVEELFPKFWRQVEDLLLVYLAVGLDARDDDAETLTDDLIGRFVHIEPTLPVDPASPVHRDLGWLLFDAVLAAQRVFAAKYGRTPGRVITGWYPPTPLKFDHKFLVSLQSVVSSLEAEANLAEGGKRAN